MATVTITFQDNADKIDLKVEFDPPAEDDVEATPAQQMGLACLQAVRELFTEV